MPTIITHLITAGSPGISGLIPENANTFQVSPDGKSILFSNSPFQSEDAFEESNTRTEYEEKIADLESDIEIEKGYTQNLSDQNDKMRADLDGKKGLIARIAKALREYRNMPCDSARSNEFWAALEAAEGAA